MKFIPNNELLLKWVKNQISFLIPLFVFIGILYMGFLLPRIEDNGISLSDFIPTNSVITAIALYVFNLVYAYLLKLRDTLKG